MCIPVFFRKWPCIYKHEEQLRKSKGEALFRFPSSVPTSRPTANCMCLDACVSAHKDNKKGSVPALSS